MSVTTKQSKGKQKAKSLEQLPSANWLALQKKIKSTSKVTSKTPPKKRRKLGTVTDDGISEAGSSIRESSSTASISRRHDLQLLLPSANAGVDLPGGKHGGESLEYLRKMVLGQLDYSEEQRQPGKYLALDCEMVGVGPEGSESSLARVSLVNYHGAIILDEFVRQRERVVDYRTFVSGVRAVDMAKAIPFTEVQKRVAELLKDRILVGHAIHNDLKALLLSQPRALVRDTQLCAGKAKLLKTKYPALRKLAEKELGVTIQAGEHSSVTDARAAMALYRLHRKEWDKAFRHGRTSGVSAKSLGKRKASAEPDGVEREDKLQGNSSVTSVKTSKKRKESRANMGEGKRGISSGLSTIVKQGEERIKLGKLGPEVEKSGGGEKDWWSTLDDVAPSAHERRERGRPKGTISMMSSR